MGKLKKANRQLQRERGLRGWSQAKLAEKLGTTVKRVSMWECGDAAPGRYYQELLIQLFGKNAQELGFLEDGELNENTNSHQVSSHMPVMSAQETNVAQFNYEGRPLPTVPMYSLEDHSMTAFDSTRRALLAQLLSIAGMTTLPLDTGAEAWERLIAITHPSPLNADAINYFHTLIETCWGLCNQGEMASAGQVLSSFLPNIIQHASRQPEAAILTAQALRLQSILNAHQLQVHTMIPLCLQAVEFARQAKDSNTLTASLIGLAVAFKYAQQPENSFHTYQEALTSCKEASPLIRSRAYAGAAASFAGKAHFQEAQRCIRLAYECFPDHPEHEPYVLSADNGLFMLAYYEGLMYLIMQEPEKAGEAFGRFSSYSSSSTIPMPERNRLEIVNHRGRAAIFANELEKYAKYLEEGLRGAITLKSKKRYDEAVHIYQEDMPGQWRAEAPIRRLAEQFRFLPGDR